MLTLIFLKVTRIFIINRSNSKVRKKERSLEEQGLTYYVFEHFHMLFYMV